MAKHIMKVKRTPRDKALCLPPPPRTLTPLMQWAMFLGDFFTRIGLTLLGISGLLYFFMIASGGLKLRQILALPLLAAALSIPTVVAWVFTLVGFVRSLLRMNLLISGLFAEGVRESVHRLIFWYPQSRWTWRRIYRIIYAFTGEDGRRYTMRQLTPDPDKFGEEQLIFYSPGTKHSLIFDHPETPDIPNGFPEINEDGTFKPNTEPMAFLVVLWAIILIVAGIFSLNLLFGKG